MKRLTLIPLLCLVLVLTGCPKKKTGDAENAGEPIEGVSTPANEKATEAPNSEEMQEQKGGNSEASPAEEKK